MIPRFSERTDSILRRAGWYPGRSCREDTASIVQRTGWPVVPAAESFLREFCGLVLCSRPRIWLVPLGKMAEIARLGAVKQEPQPRPDQDEETKSILHPTGGCTPVGERYDGSVLILLNAAGEMFEWLHSDYPAKTPLWKTGRTPDEGLEYICGTRKEVDYISGSQGIGT